MLRPTPTAVGLTEADMREYTEARRQQLAELEAAAKAAAAGAQGVGASPIGLTPPAKKLSANERIGIAFSLRSGILNIRDNTTSIDGPMRRHALF